MFERSRDSDGSVSNAEVDKLEDKQRQTTIRVLALSRTSLTFYNVARHGDRLLEASASMPLDLGSSTERSNFINVYITCYR